ncbi:hypothetical protein Pmani_030591 [Petrolisthes manimaculis]|uniref:long-chain-fatty-acid--CoA ligase n=1 Tax=Petrolisthes manimaculis TaxID=1843537 RepID=A0AAE1NVP3_9EUCA|nr:hypothetical protein Pmani_030591 [Petrolisthes manimaculis]
MGGQLKRMIVGAAPLSTKTHEAISAIFNVTLQVGYGLTETCASATCMDQDEKKTGHTGGPNLSVLLKLEDWMEGGYLVSDKPNPRGEIIVGGPSVAKGYYKQSKEVNSDFFEEHGQRWFRTGDIGEINSEGCLKIIDRKKGLVKL